MTDETTRKYPVAERFFAPQGEGLYSGTQMAFVRLVGCSVGKGVCTACDTEYDAVYPRLGGGMYDAEEVVAWAEASGCRHICLTGGEPLDRDLRPLIDEAAMPRGLSMVHVETSGTKEPPWLEHAKSVRSLWLTVSPKPGYKESMIAMADEVKVILGGLGDGPGWPTVVDALRWAQAGKLVYVQPRNDLLTVNGPNLRDALNVVAAHPQLRVSVQLHKFVGTR